MVLNHVALSASSEKRSDSFYRDILGLERMHSQHVPGELSKKIFGLEKEYIIINYGNDAIRFEIFISDSPEVGVVNHVCVNVPNMDAFLQKCESGGIPINRIPKGDYHLVFIKDFDGNLFEIKEIS